MKKTYDATNGYGETGLSVPSMKICPFDQFIVEQIAGDLLPNSTQEQLVATGFLRNSMLNEEGAIIPEQFRMVEMFDRIDCIEKAVRMTTQCAQCHSHKYDPISMSEYWSVCFSQQQL